MDTNITINGSRNIKITITTQLYECMNEVLLCNMENVLTCKPYVITMKCTLWKIYDEIYTDLCKTSLVLSLAMCVKLFKVSIHVLMVIMVDLCICVMILAGCRGIIRNLLAFVLVYKEPI